MVLSPDPVTKSMDSLVLLRYLVKGRNALTTASRDMASASTAEISELLVARDINVERLMSATIAGSLWWSMGEGSGMRSVC